MGILRRAGLISFEIDAERFDVVGNIEYSLGKAVLEHSMRLLAPELARKGVTVNAVLPSFIPVGMNAAKSSRAVLLETAKVPAGRLGSPVEVANAIEYLLSPGASFVSGQLVSLTGGQM